MSDPGDSIKTMNQPVVIFRDEAGMPHSLDIDGRRWTVIAEPVRWFERIAWWESARRMPKGTGRIDIEILQVQARLGRNEKSAPVTFNLANNQDGSPWFLREVQHAA